MMSRILPLSDGALVRVIEAGPKGGTGEPLLLIHGVGMCAEAWQPQIEALADHHRVIAVDMPGHGQSSPLPAEARLPDFVGWAARVVQALDLGPVNLAGHSMGALVAAGLAVERPDLVRRLALLNAVHRRSPQARADVIARADQIARGEGDNEAPLVRWFGPNQVAIRNKVARWLDGIDPQGYATAYRAFAEGDATYADRLCGIACPALVLTGDGDRNSSAQMSRDMAQAMPQGRALIVAGHRHMVNMTAPYIVNDALRGWLQWDDSNMMSFDPRALRDAFGCFMTGVTVVTTRSAEGAPLGFTANSFASVSLDPPLLLVSIAKTSRNYEHFAAAGHFAINVLAEEQKHVSGIFARPVEDRFAAVGWTPGPAGSPVLAGVAAWFDCRLSQRVDAGDHAILIGEVKGFSASQEPGLGYYRGAYITPAQTAAQLPTGPDVVISAIVEAWGEVLLVDEGAGLALPSTRVGRDGVQAALTRLLAGIAPDAAPGEIYAVYEDATEGRQHIAFRCPATSTEAMQGRFLPLQPAHLEAVGDPATRSMLDRLAAESRQGNYGVYFGSHLAGQVTHKHGAKA